MRLLFKVLLVLGMTLAILVPLSMIRGVIHDRQAYRAEAVADVARSYGGAQSFAGPVLVVPYTESFEVEELDKANVLRKVTRERSGRWTFFPTRLDIGGPLLPAVRKRGLHEVRVYDWQAVVGARFDAKIPPADDPARNRRIGQPWLGVGIADVRGLRWIPQLRVNGRPMAMEQGMGSRDAPGLHVRLAPPVAGQTFVLDTDLRFQLGGTESLSIAPLGKDNRIALASTWRHPSFAGTSPRQRIDNSGFTAEWQLAAVATNAQRQYLDGASATELAPVDAVAAAMGAREPGPSTTLDAVGVSLIDPVDVYTQADRATKYGLLFVLLTFVGFFMLELVKALPIHPIQYALVDLALAIFFLLLVGLSEHIAFGQAYLIASVACLGLLGFYLSAVLRSLARGIGFAAMLALLYAALYGLLVSEDNALALGSGLLFVILSALMVATRQVDWYQLSRAPRVDARRADLDPA